MVKEYLIHFPPLAPLRFARIQAFHNHKWTRQSHECFNSQISVGISLVVRSPGKDKS